MLLWNLSCIFYSVGFIFIANDILRKCKINGEFIESLTQCSDSFFVAVYEGILGEPLRGIVQTLSLCIPLY